MDLSVLPDRRADYDPLGPAVADHDADLNNAEFLDAVQCAGSMLRSRGVSADDVVAVMLPDTAALVVSLFAAWRLGAAVTPINPSRRPTEVRYQLADAGAKVLIAQTKPGFDTGTAEVVTVQELAGGDPNLDLRPDGRHEDRRALLIYTSGTTGHPKGVVLDHANLDAMCHSVADAFGLTQNDHSLLILPTFYVNGIVVGTLPPLLAGGRITVAGRFNANTFFPRIEKTRATYFSAVPMILTMLCGLPEDVETDTSSVRFALCGAAPAASEVLRRFESRYRIPVIEGYGLTEGSCASTANPLHGKRKPGTVGLPLPGQKIRLGDLSGRSVAPGEAGEIMIKGANVMRGYLNRPEETAKAIVDGWLHTGDIGRFDEDGYLTIVDRAKNVIIRGGESIYPREIESVAYQLPQIAEAAVVGRPNPAHGEEPVLFVSMHKAEVLSTDQIREHLYAVLSEHKVPVEITVVQRLPRNAIGAIDRPSLRRLSAHAG
ncbi:MAG: AMP-binding protein [Mycobacterium sp.]|nr:AMP-binding protein [Mycobacterium sp.]